ncbi:TPA: hypothetical protein OW393_005295 [Pseudomonas aeruginosa]|nr:hypothetical protein [Pseudomonas aeruginosa]HCW0892751.1 hypothetical protein [Pseudomonas aeruginosa]HCW0898610.1 hypothetical protein [Pseudomonas aeruginosa]
MIRGLDIPRGRLATLWPLQRTNQARAFDADAEAGSHVAQKKKSKASSMPRDPSPIPTRVRREASTGGGAIRTKPLAARQ